MFEYVSLDTFAEQLASQSRLGESEIAIIYHNIKLPKRATQFSAGYDFFSPVSITIPAGGRAIIPTGIKVNLNDIPNNNPDIGFFLGMYPRSSYGFRYGMRLMNTVGIIDQDYYDNSNNEGHIILAITCLTELKLTQGEAFCQGIIQPYYKIKEEEVLETRTGGLGSTTKIQEEPVVIVEEEKSELPRNNIKEEVTEEEVPEVIEIDEDNEPRPIFTIDIPMETITTQS